MYIAIIERADNSTYEQVYDDFDELVELSDHLGDDYKIVAIY